MRPLHCAALPIEEEEEAWDIRDVPREVAPGRETKDVRTHIEGRVEARTHHACITTERTKVEELIVLADTKKNGVILVIFTIPSAGHVWRFCCQ